MMYMCIINLMNEMDQRLYYNINIRSKSSHMGDIHTRFDSSFMGVQLIALMFLLISYLQLLTAYNVATLDWKLQYFYWPCIHFQLGNYSLHDQCSTRVLCLSESSSRLAMPFNKLYQSHGLLANPWICQVAETLECCFCTIPYRFVVVH